MTKKISLFSAVIAIGLSSSVIVTPASAHGDYNAQYYNYYQPNYYDDRGNYYPAEYDNRRVYDDRRYDDGRNYDRRDSRRYRGQKCKSGTTGTIIGGVVGGLLGREVGRGGRFNRPSTTGTIIGAGAGALAGRALEKSGNRC
ncbi:MAG: glycine zipper 2TM domain-containing protein [Pseudomonadota bacterium]